MVNSAFITDEVSMDRLRIIANFDRRFYPIAIEMATLCTAITCDNVHSYIRERVIWWR